MLRQAKLFFMAVERGWWEDCGSRKTSSRNLSTASN